MACSRSSLTPETDEIVNQNPSKVRLIVKCEHLEKQRNAALKLLKAYRDRVPLGHQPHMLAHQVDDILSENAK